MSVGTHARLGTEGEGVHRRGRGGGAAGRYSYSLILAIDMGLVRATYCLPSGWTSFGNILSS